MPGSVAQDRPDPASKSGGQGSVPLLLMEGVDKHFGGVRALKRANLTLPEPGVVHSLMGENGSGKSTLLGILSGQLRPDHGTVSLLGKPVSYRTPAEAVSQGVVMVSQETAVAPSLSITENVLIGRRLVRTKRGIDWPASRRRAREVLERLRLDYDPTWAVERLRPDQKQMVEIARAVSMDARILILDEPTSSLTGDEVQGLFSVIAELKAAGVATLFVSHRLDEVFTIADEVTVLRDGETVSAGPLSSYTRDSLVQAMVADPQSLVVRHRTRFALIDAPVALSAAGISAPGLLRDVSLQVRAGEIVGLAGLVGAGRSELLEAIFGKRRTAGTVTVSGSAAFKADVRSAIARGIAYVPPDRKSQGLVLTMSVAHNLTMVATHNQRRWRSPRRSRERQIGATAIRTMRIRAASPNVPVSTLSGGNQQKVAVGKWIVQSPRVMLLDEPTRGVDVNAKGEIHHRLRDLADAGVAMLVSSSENEELLDLCDRIIVMSRGAIVGDLSRAEADIAALARLTGGTP
jgi:ABC-type sugar transport system ATPase subunit